MATRRKEDALILKVRELRKEIRKKVEDELLKQCEEFKTQNKYPWEGIWLSPHEIEKVQKVMKKRDRIALGEIMVLFFLSVLLSYAFFRIMKLFFLS